MLSNLNQHLKYAHIQSFVGGSILTILIYLVVSVTGDYCKYNTSVCAFFESIFNIYLSSGDAIRSNQEYVRLVGDVPC
jgi:hypothetical protein